MSQGRGKEGVALRADGYTKDGATQVWAPPAAARDRQNRKTLPADTILPGVTPRPRRLPQRAAVRAVATAATTTTFGRTSLYATEFPE